MPGFGYQVWSTRVWFQPSGFRPKSQPCGKSAAVFDATQGKYWPESVFWNRTSKRRLHPQCEPHSRVHHKLQVDLWRQPNFFGSVAVASVLKSRQLQCETDGLGQSRKHSKCPSTGNRERK